VLVIAPLLLLDGLPGADVVHIVALELQRDLLEVVMGVARQLARVARPRLLGKVVDHEVGVLEDPAAPARVLGHLGKRVHPQLRPVDRLGTGHQKRHPLVRPFTGRGIAAAGDQVNRPALSWADRTVEAADNRQPAGTPIVQECRAVAGS
jgi:hypothetical protein